MEKENREENMECDYYDFIANCVISVLKEKISKKLERQNQRADRRLQQNKCTAGADGQCIGLEKAINILEEYQKSIADFSKSYTFSDATLQAALKFAQAYELLKQGKKIKVGMCYVHSDIPIIKLKGQDGKSEDTISMDCISKNKFDTYLVERDVPMLDEVSVVGYGSGAAEKIEYVYANPQMNRLFAVLKDGTTEDYSWNMLNMWSFEGEYEPETTMVPVEMEFYSNFVDSATGEMMKSTANTVILELPEGSNWVQVRDAVIQYVNTHAKYKKYNIKVSSALLPYDMGFVGSKEW